MTKAAEDELLSLARIVTMNAGALVKQRRSEGTAVADTKSAPEDIVTFADREAEARIRSLIADARPDDGFVGEEGEASTGSSGLTWVVDPIDGTVNYLYGLPDYAVSIAVVEGEPDPLSWRALAGVVYAPALDLVYSAAAGGGAFCGSQRLAVSSDTPLSLALVGTGFSYTSERRQREADVLRQVIGSVRDIRRIGSAALDLCRVASGQLNAYYERGLRPWDHAAGALIAAEAGAIVAGRGGTPASQDLMIAAEPELFAKLESILAKLNFSDS